VDAHQTPLSAVWEHSTIAATQEIQAREGTEGRLERLLTDACEFFETYLWESETASGARGTLAELGLDEQVLRAFGVGWAPVGPHLLMSHLRGLGYSSEDIVAAGLATRSVRGRVHGYFRSRVTFPVRDAEGQVLGFAGLGTHLGPSWPLWVTSPDAGLYKRSQAVFGLDRAVHEIAASGIALVRRDSIEVLHAHQDGQSNAVTVHTSWVTRNQMLALAEELPGGLDALQLDLPPGMTADAKDGPVGLTTIPDRVPGRSDSELGGKQADSSHLKLKRVAIVIATAVAAVNVWTGAPLFSVWVGSQAQGGQVLSLRGVVTVLVVLGILAFLLAWALAWLHKKYDELTGRPAAVSRTSPWQRRMRGELDEHLRARFSLSAPERVVAACVIAGVISFEVWFFLFAGSSLPS
jgi:DNA primase catalytic core, N-terminal domain